PASVAGGEPPPLRAARRARGPYGAPLARGLRPALQPGVDRRGGGRRVPPALQALRGGCEDAMPEALIPSFQVGGAVQAGAFYVRRPADEELPAALLRGEYCYVVAPRQIGKSSLRVQAERRLTAQGIRCVSIDLTRIGTCN